MPRRRPSGGGASGINPQYLSKSKSEVHVMANLSIPTTPPSTYTYSSSGSNLPKLPMHLRNAPISFTNADGTVGEVAYPVNFEELYNLKGRLLTLIDATFTDAEQRKAQKDVVWHTLKSWMEDIEQAHNPTPDR